MLFFSPYAALRVPIRNESVFYHPSTGVETHRVKGLCAEFGSHGGEFSYTDPLTNTVERGAIIHGNYFETDLAVEQYGWTQEEKESVENRLMWLCDKRPGLIKHVEQVAPVVLAPWPTYDDCNSEQAVALATQLGLAPEALAYEQANAQRPAVTEALAALLVDDEGEPVETAPRNIVVAPREELVPARGGETRIVVV